MEFKIIEPVKELRPYVIKLWLYENDNGFINHGTLVAPNAKPKVILPFRNDISASDCNKVDYCKQGDICFIGIRDSPVTIGAPPGPAGSIGVEFTTAGAYRFLKNPMRDLTNNLVTFSDLYGAAGVHLKQALLNEPSPLGKTMIIQHFLIQLVRWTEKNNPLVDQLVQHMWLVSESTRIRELERLTGYSTRYLEILFNSYIGISPKALQSIFRFQRFYKLVNEKKLTGLSQGKIYEFYTDQSHFIREFRRFTGFSPSQYSKFCNDFGGIF
jgi:AraC-like DNA-binding protein